MTPAEALARLGPAARGVRVTRALHRGPTKRSYLAERRDARFVLRIDEPLAAAWALDRRAEAHLLGLASAAGVGPELVAASWRAPAVFLLRYQPGRAWSPAELREPHRLRALAGLLRRVHAIHIPGPALDYAAVAVRYAHVGGTPAPKSVGTRVPPTASAAGGAPALTSVGTGVPTSPLCHHDPIPANVVGLRVPLLIDWEYAAAGEPLFDLAAVTRHHLLPKRHARYFLAAYFGGEAVVPREQMATWEEAYERVVRSWMQRLARDRRCSYGFSGVGAGAPPTK